MILVVVLCVVVVEATYLVMGYVDEHDIHFRKNIGNEVVSFSTENGVSFDIHERGFMDDIVDAGSEIVDDGRLIFDDFVEMVSGE